MSYRKDKTTPFTQAGHAGTLPSLDALMDAGPGHDLRALEALSAADLQKPFKELLHRGVHGFCFSLYEEGQKPGDTIAPEQIRKRLSILRPYTRWVRSFSCTEGNEHVATIAKEMGMKTLVGAWLGTDAEKNREELDGLVRLADQGCVDIAAVGNEVLYREELSEHELLACLAEAKERMPAVPVGYVDAYYEFYNRPALVQATDVILCNCYPFWEGTAFEDSLAHMNHMVQLATQVAHGKKVLITETGWPSSGEPFRGAQPSVMHAMKYFIGTHLWAQANGVETFYFSSFDETWKTGTEGDVGAYWGVWNSDGTPKYY